MLEYAILGFLSYKPTSGYDLKKVFDSSVHHFWPADQSQIYRTLSRLTENGWVTMEKVAQDDRPDRKVYHISQSGHQSLLTWLAGPPAMDPSRNSALIQVFFSGKLPDSAVIEKFQGFAQFMRMVLAAYDRIPGQWDEYTELSSARERFFWNLTLEMGLVNMRANLAWAEGVIRRLKNGEAPGA